MKKTLIFAAFLLAAAAGVIIYGGTRIMDPTFHGKLTDVLPEPPPGWEIVKREIADTPEMKEAVDELLNYDDGIFVDYINGPIRLSVYIAYWTPGKMSHRLVAAHTPDICWVANGWKKESSEVVTGLSIGETRLPPAEGRLFTIQGKGEYVWFWHLVGGEAKSYGTGYTPPWYAPLTDLATRGLNQREEQFFIRLSSQTPLNTPSLKPLIDRLLETLPLVHGAASDE